MMEAMVSVSDEQFEQFVSAGIDAIPERFLDNLKNVAFVTGTVPTPEQRAKLELRHDQSLYGLYEGIPLTKRGNNYNLVLPDKITIFKVPMEHNCNSAEEVKEQVRHTVWHEVAHYYGLNHEQIHALEHEPGES
jgi:predicted Zn-dependent protease with MMP-like domain